MCDRRTWDEYESIPLDTNSITQHQLNIDAKERSNLFPWNGQFSPQLIELLLKAYARPDTFVFDPFLGSGTVLCEAGRRGLPAFGTEINPAAFKMAETYRLINVSVDMRRSIVKSLEGQLVEAIPETLPIFAHSEEPPTSDCLKTGPCGSQR